LKSTVSRVWAIPPQFQMLLAGERTLLDSEVLSDYSNLSDSQGGLLVMVLVCADAVDAALTKLSTGCSEQHTLEILNQLGTLGQRNGSRVVTTVALLLGDSNHAIRQAAHKTLLKIARLGDREAVEVLSESLRKPGTRDATVEALKMIAEVGDEDAMFVMMSYLQSHGERVGGDSETLVEFKTNVELTHDRDAKIRRTLERAGYDREQLEECKFLASLFRWKTQGDLPYQTLVGEGEWQLGKPFLRYGYLDESAFPLALILTFQSENNVEVCLAALEVLGHVAGKGNLDAIAAVASCLEDESDDVQWKAVEQLGLVIAAGDNFSIQHAKKRLSHEDRRVRWAAQEALGQFSERSV